MSETIQLDQNSEILGPFLCRPSATSMSFWFCTPANSAAPTVRIGDNNATLEEVSSSLIDLPFKIWLGTIDGLTPDTCYVYKASIGNAALEFPNGTAEDFSFNTLRTEQNAEKDKFILMSCHGVDDYNKIKDPEFSTFNMWVRVLKAIDSNSDIRFGFLAGDQVYMDEKFNEYLISPNGIKTDQEIIKDSIGTYYRFWSDVSYRKSMARMAFLLTWDDHDLIDGWGSRDEQRLPKFKNKWNQYYVVQKEICRLMQFCRNPGETSADQENFSFTFDHGNSLFTAFDLRAERDIGVKQMLGKKQKEAFEKVVQKSITGNHFVISSVTMARMNSKVEKGIGKVSNLVWQLSSAWGYEPNLWKVFAWMLIIVWALIPRVYPILGNQEIPRIFSFLIPAFFMLKYSKKFKMTLGWKGISALGSFLGLGLIVSVLDLCFSDLSKFMYSEAQFVHQSYCLGVTVLGTFLLSWIILKAKSNKKKICSIGLIGIGWIIYFLFTPNPIFAPTDLFLSLIAIVSVIFTVLEAKGVIDQIAGLDDDTEDSWSSATNESSLSWFLKTVSNSKMKTVVLSGDIHTGGISQLKLSVGGVIQKIPQIVASPITYPVMPKLVEKITSSPDVQISRIGDINFRTYNLFYRSQRNFCIIEPRSSGVNAEFHFEDLNEPMRILNVHDL